MPSKQNTKLTFAFWQNLSGSKKIGLIGSIALLISVFMPWYSDIDVFRTGDIYSGISGPLYLFGWSIVALGIGNLVFMFGGQFFEKLGIGKFQMIAGFSALYLLVMVNSVYFHPKFGLNVLSKQAEYGSVVSLVAILMICVSGFLAYQSKGEPKQRAEVAEPVAVKQEETVQQVTEAPAEKFPDKPSAAYQQMRRLMEKDTMSPAQRRAKQETNAFLGNAPTGTFSGQAESGEKKPQPYRMDL